MALGLVGLIGIAVGGATFLYAKKKKTSNGTAAVAGVTAGAGSAGAAMLVGAIVSTLAPFLIIGAAAFGIYSLAKGSDQKALPPSR